MKRSLIGAIVLLGLQATAQAGIALPSTPGSSIQYGNFQSYSLGVLNTIYQIQTNTNGTPYSIDASTGQIKDGVVIGTGSSGNPVITNSTDIDDAYPTPSGSVSFFGTQNFEPDNGPAVGDNSGTWDATLASLRTALGTNLFAPAFGMAEEGNEGLDGVDLLAWAKFTLVDLDKAVGDPLREQSYYLSSSDNLATLQDELALGLAASAAGGPVSAGTIPPLDVTDPSWAYVHGYVTLKADGTFAHYGKKTNTDPSDYVQVSQNLGINDAAFVIFNQELNDIIHDASSRFDILRIDGRMAQLNGSGEQLFLAEGVTILSPVPEPTTLVVWSALALVVGAARFRRRPTA